VGFGVGIGIGIGGGWVGVRRPGAALFSLRFL
jgi:hypothetical protein